MLADWKRPSSVSKAWPLGWGAWGAAVQLGIEIDTGLASLSDPGPSADGINAYLRIELPKPRPPGDRKYAVEPVSVTMGGARLGCSPLKHMPYTVPPESEAILSIDMIAPVALKVPKSFAVTYQRV